MVRLEMRGQRKKTTFIFWHIWEVWTNQHVNFIDERFEIDGQKISSRNDTGSILYLSCFFREKDTFFYFLMRDGFRGCDVDWDHSHVSEWLFLQQHTVKLLCEAVNGEREKWVLNRWTWWEREREREFEVKWPLYYICRCLFRKMAKGNAVWTNNNAGKCWMYVSNVKRIHTVGGGIARNAKETRWKRERARWSVREKMEWRRWQAGGWPVDSQESWRKWWLFAFWSDIAMATVQIVWYSRVGYYKIQTGSTYINCSLEWVLFVLSFEARFRYVCICLMLIVVAVLIIMGSPRMRTIERESAMYVFCDTIVMLTMLCMNDATLSKLTLTIFNSRRSHSYKTHAHTHTHILTPSLTRSHCFLLHRTNINSNFQSPNACKIYWLRSVWKSCPSQSTIWPLHFVENVYDFDYSQPHFGCYILENYFLWMWIFVCYLDGQMYDAARIQLKGKLTERC